MIPVDVRLLDALTNKAKNSPRKRTNHNFHKEAGDILQRMLNAIEPGTYVQPHKHEAPDKREVFILLRGKALVIFFDEEGNITSGYKLEKEIGHLGVEIPPRTWHTIASLETGTVVYELKDGPYNPVDDKNFATWAPREGDEEAEDYLDGLLKNYFNNGY